MKTCLVDGCNIKTHAKGYCAAHYARITRYGKVGAVKINPPNGSIPLEVRFWSRVNKTNKCWLWTGNKNGKGYGQFSIKHVYYLAHRVSYELIIGKIPGGLDLDHLCRTPLCVRPSHLEPVTRLENSMRGNHPTYVAARNGTCTKGHPRERMYFRKSNGKPVYCKDCAKEKRLANKRKKT